MRRIQSIICVPVTTKPNKRQGTSRREKHSAQFKAKIIHECETADNTVRSVGKVLYQPVSSLKMDKETIIQQSTLVNRKLLTKQRPLTKYNKLFGALMLQLRETRAKVHQVNFNWLWSRARIIYRKQQNDDSAIVTKHATESFLKKYNVRMLSRQHNKKLSKEAYRNDFKKWQAFTRERLLRTGFNDSYDETWGRFKPDQRFNVDQTPMPFSVNTKRTYEKIQPNRQEKVWIAQPGSGLDKRQCTIQMMTRAKGEQPRIAIGTGKIIREDESAAWHSQVEVYWQPNAWADTDFSLK